MGNSKIVKKRKARAERHATKIAVRRKAVTAMAERDCTPEQRHHLLNGYDPESGETYTSLAEFNAALIKLGGLTWSETMHVQDTTRTLQHMIAFDLYDEPGWGWAKLPVLV
jgi:hypothetical protein